jgi:hypothetical protein
LLGQDNDYLTADWCYYYKVGLTGLDTFDYELEKIHANISSCLSHEEYFAGVIFDSKLVYDLLLAGKINETYCWQINTREGYIQEGKFGDKHNYLKWTWIYRHITDDPTKVRMNLGDLLVLVPLLQWKKYFVALDFGNQSQTIRAEILFANLKEAGERLVYLRYWEERIAEHIETEGLPWVTEEESNKMFEEAIWLKNTPGPSDSQPYRDLIYQYFRPEVLDRYRDNKFCLN